jgi:hypothetical protein
LKSPLWIKETRFVLMGCGVFVVCGPNLGVQTRVFGIIIYRWS